MKATTVLSLFGAAAVAKAQENFLVRSLTTYSLTESATGSIAFYVQHPQKSTQSFYCSTAL